MEEETHIYQNGKLYLTIDKYLPIKKATIFARNSGLTGRLEIQHLLKYHTEIIIYSIFFINQKDEIVGRISPYLHSLGACE